MITNREKAEIASIVLHSSECSPERKKFLRNKIRAHTPADPLEQNAEIKKLIDKLCLGWGEVAIYRWGRDCDQCESDSVHMIPATVTAFKAFERMVYKNAEGPTSVMLISFDDYEEFEPSFRDHRAEQYNY